MKGTVLGRGEVDSLTQIKEKYVVDGNGQRVAVMLDIAEYEEILRELEELESVRAFDAAKAAQDKAVPLEKALKEIEEGGG